jgi:TolB protein
MTHALRSTSSRLVVVAAFLLVLMTAGCAGRSIFNRSPRPGPIPMPVAKKSAPTAAPRPPAAQMPRVINVFGEFDGIGPTRIGPRGEAGFQQHTFVDEGFDSEVAVSPDGRYIVFSSTRHSEIPDIYMQRVNGMSVTQLTSDTSEDAFPVFSPDGRRIAFASTRSGSWDIYIMDVDGKNVVQVTSGPMHDLHPSFSPDGRRLVYCSTGGRSGEWELWTVSLDSGERRMIGFGLFPSWSPSSHKDQIAFQRARQRGSRWFSLWTLDLVDGEARSVTEVAVSGNAAVVSPKWSPDGKRLTFSTILDPTESTIAAQGGQQDIWIINADGTNRQRLTDGTGTNASPFWSVDNRVFFISDRGGMECVWSAQVPAGGMMTAGNDGQSQGRDAIGSTDMNDMMR